jgi:hypothetical protein
LAIVSASHPRIIIVFVWNPGHCCLSIGLGSCCRNLLIELSGSTTLDALDKDEGYKTQAYKSNDCKHSGFGTFVLEEAFGVRRRCLRGQ